MKDLLISLFALSAYSGLLVILEVCARKYGISSEWLRRITHVSGALFVVVLYFLLPGIYLLFLVSIFAVVMFFSHRFRIMSHIHNVSRKTVGEELLPIGFIAAYLLSSGKAQMFLPAILIVGLADPLGGIMVQQCSSQRLRSIIFFLVTMSILFIFSLHSLISTICLAAFLTIIERISPYGSDNLTLPLATGIIMRMLPV